MEKKGFLYVGTGVSGGEDGARYGPSLMPGGSEKAWWDIRNIENKKKRTGSCREHIKPIFQEIAAKADGQPCCDWVN